MHMLVRLLLTAVHQQFIHIVALRTWGETTTADHIAAVDRADFPVLLRLIDIMVARGEAPDMTMLELPAPGGSVPGVIAAELALERRLRAAIAAAPASKLVAAAALPRDAYLAWLESQDLQGAPENARPADDNAVLLAQLLLAIEQGLVHAFVFWHADEQALADAAWGSSGAAMVHAMALAGRCAAQGFVPNAQAAAETGLLHAPHIGWVRAEISAYEQAMTVACGNAAAQCAPEIAAYYRSVPAWPPSAAHFATNNPTSLRSFASAWRKFVAQ